MPSGILIHPAVLGTIDTAEYWGGLCRFFEEVELGLHLTQCRLGRVEAYLPTKWHLEQSSHLATIDMGRKLGAVPLSGSGTWFPSYTMWPG